jgi:hypothetical protein
MSRGLEYNTGVSGRFPEAGNNVALSRALLSVGTISSHDGPARARPAQLNDCPNLPVINFGALVKHSRGFFR